MTDPGSLTGREDVEALDDLQHYMEATSRLRNEVARLEARLVEVERALPGVEHLDIAVKALRQMGFFDSASAMLGLRNEISP